MKSPRVAVSVVFFLLGIASGTWASRIPAIKENLGLDVGPLGLALLGGGLGTLLTTAPTGALLTRLGSRQVAPWAAVLTCVSLVFLALAQDAISLFVCMVLWGAASGALDITMNAQGSAIEQRGGRPIMSSLHGLWSMGAMSGAAIGAVVAGVGISVQVHFLVVAPLLLIALVAATRLFVPDIEHVGSVPAFAWPRGILLALAAVAFCAVATEGAMLDWAGVYLRTVLDAPEGTAALAPSFFSAAMAIGRLSGDPIIARLRAPTVARMCAVIAAVGMAAIILAPGSVIVFAGLVAVGLGISVLVPLVFGAAGRTRDMHTGTAIAAVASVGYLAFLVGPPTIGLVAEHVTLRGAFLVLLALLGLIAVLAPATGEGQTEPNVILDAPG